MFCFKNLIHIFVVIIVVSFFGMFYIIFSESESAFSQEIKEYEEEASLLKTFIMAHPLAWGLEKSGYNVTGAIDATKERYLGNSKITGMSRS